MAEQNKLVLKQVFQKLLISWKFHTEQSLQFLRIGAKNQKHRLSDSSVGATPSWERKMARLFQAAWKDTVTTLSSLNTQPKQ